MTERTGYNHSMQRTSQKLWQLGAAQLARLVSSGEVSSSEVVAAHIQRIEAVNPSLNAVVETFFDQATETAKRLDNDPHF